MTKGPYILYPGSKTHVPMFFSSSEIHLPTPHTPFRTSYPLQTFPLAASLPLYCRRIKNPLGPVFKTRSVHEGLLLSLDLRHSLIESSDYRGGRGRVGTRGLDSSLIESSDYRGGRVSTRGLDSSLIESSDYRGGKRQGQYNGTGLLTDTEFRLQRGEEAGSVQGDWTPH